MRVKVVLIRLLMITNRPYTSLFIEEGGWTLYKLIFRANSTNLANNRSTKLGTLICSAHARTVRPIGADCPRPGALLGLLPDGRTVRALGPDGPHVRRDGGRSPTAPGSRSREGPRRGGEILGVV